MGTREAGWETQAAAEYTRRLERGVPTLRARTTFHPTPEALALGTASLKPPLIVLDHRSVSRPTTEEFADLLFEQWLTVDGGRVSFVVGGAEGLPEGLREGCYRLSLSNLTFPHRVARVLLLEQLFRAREVRAASGYHVDPSYVASDVTEK